MASPIMIATISAIVTGAPRLVSTGGTLTRPFPRRCPHGCSPFSEEIHAGRYRPGAPWLTRSSDIEWHAPATRDCPGPVLTWHYRTGTKSRVLLPWNGRDPRTSTCAD